MKNRCVNYAVCGNTTRHNGKLCEECERAARQADQGRERETLAKLEQKPRGWRDVWSVRKG